jgi:hypothetical protein
MEECRGGPFPRTRSHPASCETPSHHYNPRWASRYRDRDFAGLTPTSPATECFLVKNCAPGPSVE